MAAPTTEMIDHALNAFIVEQAVVVNERMRLLLKFGEVEPLPYRGSAQQNCSGVIGVMVEQAELDEVQGRLNRLTLLIASCRAIIWLMTSTESRGVLHFPVLRAKLPYVIALVLMLVEADQVELDTEGTITLSAFAEFYAYLRIWKESIK